MMTAFCVSIGPSILRSFLPFFFYDIHDTEITAYETAVIPLFIFDRSMLCMLDFHSYVGYQKAQDAPC